MTIEELKKHVEESQSKYPKKYIKESFDVINKLNDIKECELTISSIKAEPFKANLEKNPDKGFTVSFEGIEAFPKLMTTENWLDTEITLKGNDIKLNIIRAHSVGTGNRFKLSRENGQELFQGQLTVNVHIEEFNLKPEEKSFYR